MARRPATKILGVAFALGAALIFSSALLSELRREQQARACAAGEIAACEARCRRDEPSACGELERRCALPEAPACEALLRAKGARERRTRW